ncbi:F-box domain-containing protein [Heracleum sosnowskyi]|uniref:F-box domain-containing protein n=1 Tax=Heracleum sosnowskyi TaxID=360622 RepID=A0AAD8GQP6_9APIA|nr:F-box domain-containing protein [Heracleum sosnowskyi]
MARTRRKFNPTLSEDLISEILVRVPVKSLLRFQSVSQTWLSLIKDPAFVKSQLLHSTTIKTDQTLIVSRYKGFEEKNYLLLNVDSREIEGDFKFPNITPYNYKHTSMFRLVGSANGIVCVAVGADYTNLRPNIYLWNPATRQSKLIPWSSIYCVAEEAFGFGYDEVDHDFKVVRVVIVQVESRTSCQAEVYSANMNVWRKVPDPIDFPLSKHFDVCVNGFLCSIGKHGMMVFDLNKEVVNCAIKLPVNISGYKDARIIEFNNSVAVVQMRNTFNFVDKNFVFDGKINIWTLNDDACLHGSGVEASWTLLCSIDTVAAEIIHGYFSKRDLLLLINYHSEDYAWISCDVDKKEAKIVSLSVDMAYYDYTRFIYKHTLSLVSLAGFKQFN